MPGARVDLGTACVQRRDMTNLAAIDNPLVMRNPQFISRINGLKCGSAGHNVRAIKCGPLSAGCKAVWVIKCRAWAAFKM